MERQHVKPILGVLGGMGALASAEFLRSIYEACPSGPEQDAPTVAVYSDPTFPDRTEAFLRGNSEELLVRLQDALARLRQLGATRFVLCCVTLHHLLPRLPPETRASIVSLLDVIFAQLEESDEKHLLLCSSGARALNLFQSHPAWSRSEHRVVLPGTDDQARLHELIFQVKQNHGIATMVCFLASLAEKHGVSSFIAGCSELHIVAKRWSTEAGGAHLRGWVDPFAILAREWALGRTR